MFAHILQHSTQTQLSRSQTAWASQILLQGLPAPRHCLYCFGLGFINKPALQPSQFWHLVKPFFFFSFSFIFLTD